MTDGESVQDTTSESDESKMTETIIAEMRVSVAEDPDDLDQRWSFVQVLVSEKNPKTLANVSLAAGVTLSSPTSA